MSLTPDELERRRHYITATDVPQICGKSPWGNASDVYAAKVYGKVFAGNKATEAGNLLEPSVLEWARGELGGIIAGDWFVHDNGINACSLDSRTLEGEPIEAKTSGIVGPGTPQQWGQAGTDEIPQYYLLQVHAQLLVTGTRRAFVPALLGGKGFVMYQVRFNQRIADWILHVSEQFWETHIRERVQPENWLPSLETLKHLRREPETVVDIPDELVKEYQAAKAREAVAAKQAEDAQRRLLAAIGAAEAGRYSAGLITYYEQTRKAHEVAASTFRQIRVKAEKKALVTT